MRQARAVSMPNETLYIEEVKFWLKIMQEHTKFIRGAVGVAHADLLEESREFSKAFTSLLQKAERTKSLKEPGAFLREAADATQEFCRYQRKLLHEKLCGRLGGVCYPFLIDHLIREAQCFHELLERLQGGDAALKLGSHTKSAVVWLRFMSDHTKLIYHLIDPSERRMLKLAQDFSALFDTLVAEGRDLSSMLYGEAAQIRAFHRFLLDVRSDVQRLRDFNRMAEELVADCRLLGVLTAEVAAHMKREAEHCLLVVALLEKEIIRHCPDAFQDDIESDVWQAPAPDCRDSDETEVPLAPPESSPQEETSENACPRAEDGAPEPPGSSVEKDAAEPVIAIFDADAPESAEEAAAVCEDALREAGPQMPESSSGSLPDALSSMENVAAQESVPAAPLGESAAAPVLPVSLPEAAASPEPDEIPAAIAPENTACQTPSQNELPQKERVYAKASDYKLMPNKYAGKAPGERVREKSGRKLPRALGKKA